MAIQAFWRLVQTWSCRWARACSGRVGQAIIPA